MTMQLRISDGTLTVDMAGSTTGITGSTYFPLAPSATDTSVSEQAELVCSGTAANIRSALNNIERLLLAAAQRRATNYGTKVFIEYKPVAGDGLYRSECYGGRLVFSEDPGARRFDDTSPKIKVAVVWERAPWWEGAETEIELSSNGYAAATGGRTITNVGSSAYVQVAAAQVTGTLPAPVRLRVFNTAGSSRGFANFYVGLNSFSAPSTFLGQIEGEAEVYGGTGTGSGACSGGNYQAFSITSTKTLMGRWTIPAAMMAGNGRWFRLLCRFATYATGDRVTPVIYDSGGSLQLWEGDEVVLNATPSRIDLVDLGSVPIPPGPYDANYAQVQLGLKMRTLTGSSTVGVDYFQFHALDGYRHLYQLGYSTANNAGVEIDEIEGVTYVTAGVAGDRMPIIVPRGTPLMLQPNTLQRIYTLADLGTGTNTITDTMSVRAWIRPRRATV
jgi:hypothetical protein